MSTTQSERLRELLEPLVRSQGLELEEIVVDSVGRKRVLRVVVDSDTGADLDAVAEVSRALSVKLDESDAMGQEAYDLEVGTPGAERALTEHRHYVRAKDRLVRFQLHEGGELVARILGVDDDGLDLEAPESRAARPPPAGSPSPTSPRRACRWSSTARTTTRDTTDEEERRVKIDMTALRGLEREKEISFDLVVEAIETALLIAYRHTEGAAHARVELDRKSGQVAVLAQEPEGGGAGAARVRRHPARLRPDRRDDRQAGHPAAAARGRGRGALRRVRRPRG